MSFTIKPDGSIQVETIDELRAVLKVQQEHAPPQRQQPPQQTVAIVRPKATPARTLFGGGYRKLYDESPTQQRALLDTLQTRPGASDDDLRVALNLGNNLDLRGLLIGISRRAKNMGLDAPLVTDVTRKGKARQYNYTLTAAFIHGMKDEDAAAS